MLAELFYSLQDGNTPLHHATMGGHTTFVEHILSTPGIDVNIQNRVNWCTEFENKICTAIVTVSDHGLHVHVHIVPTPGW